MTMFGLLAQRDATVHMPGQYSTYAADVDFAFYFVFWLSVFFTVLIAALVVFFAMRYRRRADRLEADKAPAHHTALEMTWTIIPLILVIAIFYYGFTGYVNISTPPENAYEIVVDAYQWNFLFEYPNGAVSDTLYIPADTPVQLTLTSRDVIHAVFIPAFRAKRDVVPERFNTMWFEATWNDDSRHKYPLSQLAFDGVIGDEFDEPYEGIVHDLYCAEYCGRDHSVMLSKVVVLQPDDFAEVVEEIAELEGPPLEVGETLVNRQGCLQCHVLEGEGTQAPSFENLYGYEFDYDDGVSRTVDEAHIRDSLINPRRLTRAGYRDEMPAFDALSERELYAITQFIRSLSDQYDEVPGEEMPDDEFMQDWTTRMQEGTP